MQDLKGKVVLVRWWTDTCELCAGGERDYSKLHEQIARLLAE